MLDPVHIEIIRTFLDDEFESLVDSLAPQMGMDEAISTAEQIIAALDDELKGRN